jgi:hypothetical protein
MKIYKPLQSYLTLTYKRWVLLRWGTHAKVEVTNPFGSIGHRADRTRGSDGLFQFQAMKLPNGGKWTASNPDRFTPVKN